MEKPSYGNSDIFILTRHPIPVDMQVSAVTVCHYVGVKRRIEFIVVICAM